MYVLPPCELQCVSGPLKISSSRCGVGLIYQTLEAPSRQSQLLPTSSLGNFDTFASRKPAPGFGRRSLPTAGVSSHLRLITELLMSLWHRDWLMTLTGQFQGSPAAAGSSDVEWPWKSSTGRNALFVMTWSMRADRWRRFGPSHRSAAVLAWVLDVFLCPPLVWIYLYFPMLRFISCAAEQRQVVRITNPATCL